MGQEQEGRAKISNPDRIQRIFNKICEAGLQVMMRAPGSRSTAVRGKVSSLQNVTGKGPGVVVSDLSEIGVQHLSQAKNLRVELKGMTTHVIFDGPILSRIPSGVIIGMPRSLLSVERRHNVRFQTSAEFCGFVELSALAQVSGKITEPPSIHGYEEFANRLRIVDISNGGMCLMTRFPSALESIGPGVVDRKARIHLPMQASLPIEFEVRWFKRIREKVNGQVDETFSRRVLFGVETRIESELTRRAIVKFVKDLSLAEAV